MRHDQQPTATVRWSGGSSLGHRGRKVDPLFLYRKLSLKGDERLDERGRTKMLAGLRFGDPHDEVFGAWLAKKNPVRAVYLVDDPDAAAEILDNAIAACAGNDVPEIRTLAHTLSRLAHRDLEPPPHRRALNGPTEGLNFCAKQVKRAGRGFVRTSITTGSGFSFTQVGSPGPVPSGLRGSGDFLPTETGRALLVGFRSVE